MPRFGSFILRLAIFFAAFAVVAWFLFEWKIYTGDFNTLFLRTENWGWLAVIFIVGMIVTKVLEGLLQWLWHSEFAVRHRRTRR